MSNNGEQRLADLAKLVQGEVEGDQSVIIRSVAPIDSASEGDISFVANQKYLSKIETTNASALILAPGVDCTRIPVLRHANPYLAYSYIVDKLYPDDRKVQLGIHSSAVVSSTATIDKQAAIGAHCHVGDKSSIAEGTQLMASVYIGNNVSIGSGCLLYPGVKIMDDCKIADRVILHPGVVVGSDGFGFAPSDKGLKKIKQIGWVEIGCDVEIGSNSTIDRGAIGPTRIGRGTKIDNLVMIAHNVEIGEDSIIIAQVGISGSTHIGNRVILAGQVGVVGHLEIGDDAQIGAQSGVSKSVSPGKKMFGSPAREIIQTKKIEAAQKRLPDLLKRVKRLEDNQPDKSED